MAQPSRPYDTLYDPTYTLSGARDHYKQQSSSSNYKLEKVGQFGNLFSELAHHPAQSYRLKASHDVPEFVDRGFHPAVATRNELTVKSDAGLVSGTNRYMYFKRPLLAAPGARTMAQAPVPTLASSPAMAQGLIQAAPATRTTGTQSDYRESEAQTLPWTPDYVVPTHPNEKQQHLSQEVQQLEKLREKRAFEAALPPLNDLERLPLRQRMIDAWEANEWAEREREILGVQDERLMLLEQALQVREDEIEDEARRRVDAQTSTLLQHKAGKFATIQSSRIKTLRQLSAAHKAVGSLNKATKTNIVEQYANYASTVYAPVQREGRFPETKPKGREVDTSAYQLSSVQAVVDMQSSLPPKVLEPKIKAPKPPAKLNYKQRKDLGVQQDLQTISDLMTTAKSTKGRGYGDCWPAPLAEHPHATGTHKRLTGRTADRPKTPEAPPLPATARTEAAVVLLQRLIRGCAAQSWIAAGRERRLPLIWELRLEEDRQQIQQQQQKHPGGNHDELGTHIDRVIGEAISELCQVLAQPDAAKREAFLAKLAAGRQAAAAAAVATAPAAVGLPSGEPAAAAAEAAAEPPLGEREAVAAQTEAAGTDVAGAGDAAELGPLQVADVDAVGTAAAESPAAVAATDRDAAAASPAAAQAGDATDRGQEQQRDAERPVPPADGIPSAQDEGDTRVVGSEEEEALAAPQQNDPIRDRQPSAAGEAHPTEDSVNSAPAQAADANQEQQEQQQQQQQQQTVDVAQQPPVESQPSDTEPQQPQEQATEPEVAQQKPRGSLLHIFADTANQVDDCGAVGEQVPDGQGGEAAGDVNL